MGAAWQGEVECARALLAGGADRTLRCEHGVFVGKTAREIAEKQGRAELAALLRSPAEQAAFEKRQALDKHLCDAAGEGDTAAIERLAAEGASPDARGGYNEAPAVVIAVCEGHAGAVSALVWLEADLDARDSRGETALMEAAAMGEVE